MFGNLEAPQELLESLKANITSGKYNGYAPSSGYLDARQAIAQQSSNDLSHIDASDVIITSGCSSALEMAINVLAEENDNILLPAPGFSLYKTLCDHKGIEARYYKLDPSRDWAIDLADLESKINENTKALLINNPSNPCGSVFTKEHLCEIVKLAEKHHLPIIADEIYAYMTFEGYEFFPIASLSKNVPVLTCGGIAKAFLVPGWRVGWVVVHDRQGLFEEVKIGLQKQSQLILGANTLAQSILSDALLKTSESFHQDLLKTLQTHANFLYDRLSKVDGLVCIKPGGAMYMMIGFDTKKLPGISDDIELTKLLLEEENVFVLPGTIFNFKNYIRLVICPPLDKLEDACNRIEAFIARHRKV